MTMIERGIPLPPRPRQVSKYPFGRMEVNESVYVPASDAAHARDAAYHIKGRRFATRSENGGMRIWRIA